MRSRCICSGKHARSLQPGVWTASPPTSPPTTATDLTAEGTQRRSGSENDNYELCLLHVSKTNAIWSQKSMKAIVYYVRRHTSMMSSGEIRLHGFCSDLEFQLGWPIRFPERNICVKFQSANGSMLADTERTIFSILLNKLQMPLQSMSLREQRHELYKRKTLGRWESWNIENIYFLK